MTPTADAGARLAQLLGRLEAPVVQAGMGGAAGPELAGAVSTAGGLGTVGTVDARSFAAALADARRRAPDRPVAANLLAPFVRDAHVSACIDHGAAAVVFHAGLPADAAARLRAAGIPVLATAGSADEARRAVATGIDGLVAQGEEAGGHLVATAPLAELLPQVLTIAGGRPVLAAGGVADATDVRRLLDAGAAAAIAGTRFLMTEESRAHDAYKQRVAAASDTLVTMLFGVGWPLRHRVVPNAATDRWCRDARLAKPLERLIELSGPIGRRLPLSALDRLVSRQTTAIPLFSPQLPLADMDPGSVDAMALYAGETAARIDDVIPAAEAVARLSP